MEEQAKPTVSVVMITYGHEAFIRQAIEGVLMQECDFPVELIVADDCSPDNTPAVMQEILTTHPRASWVRYVRHEKNKGMMPNCIWALQQAHGKYIAFCEGDDYWTDPLKLQKQVDFLEENKEYVLSFHDVIIVEENKVISSSYLSLENRNDLDENEMIKNLKYAPTLSWCFRNCIIEYPKQILNSSLGDMFLLSLLGNFGKAKYQAEIEIGAVHRFHDGGVWSKKTLCKRHEMIRILYSSLKNYYEDINKKEIYKFYLEKYLINNERLLYYSIQEKNKKLVLRSFCYNLWENKIILKPYKLLVLIKTIMKYLLIK